MPVMPLQAAWALEYNFLMIYLNKKPLLIHQALDPV